MNHSRTTAGWIRTLRALATSGLWILFVVPASPNYQLPELDFGSGSAQSSSPTYQLRSSSGETSGAPAVGASYRARPGFLFAAQASVPPAPTLQNVANTYNRLQLTIDRSGNLLNAARFAVAISTDGFSTTNYVQSDGTVGASLGSEDWLTYAAWGGASGSAITGLTASTSYTVKVTARSSNFSDTPYGATSTASTSSGPTLSFDLDVSATDTETAPPYALSLGTLDPGTVTTASARIWIDVASNAASGVSVYALSATGGLRSSSESYTISGYAGDLAGTLEGIGLQSASATQSSGGPLSAASGFGGSGATVGSVSTTLVEVLTSQAALGGGRASLWLKAKASSVTPEATDYADTLTLVAAGSF